MANVRSPYYRKMYLIGIYSPLEEGEQLLALCDNAKQFADLMEITEEDANMILFRIFNKKTNFIRFFIFTSISSCYKYYLMPLSP